MSNKFIRAADDARRLLQGFKAVQEVADAFELAGTVMQAQAEAQAALDAFRPQLEAAKAELANVKSAAKAEHAKSLKALGESKSQADLVLKAAQDKADDLLSAARLTLAHAKTEADEIQAAAAEALELSRKARDAVAEEIVALQGKLDELRSAAAKLLGS
jgi:hypothetical protein